MCFMAQSATEPGHKQPGCLKSTRKRYAEYKPCNLYAVIRDSILIIKILYNKNFHINNTSTLTRKPLTAHITHYTEVIVIFV